METNNLKQHTFNIAARHLLGRLDPNDRGQRKKSEGFFYNAQGEKIWGERYRGRLRRKCVIGILIPDSKYSEELEGKEVRNPLVLAAVGDEYSKDEDFLHGLQVIHDMKDEKHWLDELFYYAEKCGLHYPSDLLPPSDPKA